MEVTKNKGEMSVCYNCIDSMGGDRHSCKRC